MKLGKHRFTFYLLQLEAHLSNAEKTVNPALSLYQQDARTICFMLEGLAKMYKNLHNPKKFGKLLEQFKMLEDALGQIDFYETTARQMESVAGIPELATGYLYAQSREKVQHLNDLLQNEGWTGKEKTRLRKIREKLEEAEWLKPEKELEAIETYYRDEMKEIKDFMPVRFTEMEAEVHEMRRDLRWLSIYPHALQGAIQFHDDLDTAKSMEKYLTEAILQSPFNRFPEPGLNEKALFLSRKNFLALSWIISDLGRIKDEGLHFYALAEALEQTVRLSPEAALTEAIRLCGKSPDAIDRLLEEATASCQGFFSGNYLQDLLEGIHAVITEKAEA